MYESVHSILQHNSTHPQQQPLESDLENLKLTLKQMNLSALSKEQLKLLSALGALSYLGEYGVDFLKEIESKTGIDAATATQNVENAQGILGSALDRSESIISALEDIKTITTEDREIANDLALVRVEFKDEASITNVVELKSWSSTWHDIARGITMALNDAPESVKVVGATNGSIIMELGVTYAAAKLITGIVNQVISTAAQFTELQIAREELRKKHLINDQLEKGFKDKIDSIKNANLDSITQKTKKSTDGEIENDVEIALRKSISQLLDFHEKGGEVDCVPPETTDKTEQQEELTSLRKSVENLRVAQKELKRLNHQQNIQQ